MKKPNRILFSSLVPVFAFLISAAPLSVRAADEKPDVGPPPAPEETKAIDELGKHGVFASPIAAGYNWRSINFRGADKPDAELYGQIKSIPSIVELDLAGSKFTPADLANVSGLQNLRKLNLASSNVTDDGLAALEKLPKLEWLNLFSTGVTDAGLDHVAAIKTLKKVYLFESKVTDAGVEKLKAALPTLKVDRGWDKNAVAVPAAQAAPAEAKKSDAPPAPKPEEKKPETPPAPKPEEKAAAPAAPQTPPAAPAPAAAPAPNAAPATPPAAQPAKPAEPAK